MEPMPSTPASEIYQNLGPLVMGAGLLPPALPPKNSGRILFRFLPKKQKFRQIVYHLSTSRKISRKKNQFNKKCL